MTSFYFSRGWFVEVTSCLTEGQRDENALLVEFVILRID
jgi:hypothetical protein